MRIDLLSLLTEYGCTDPGRTRETVISGCMLSAAQIRDRLYLLGNILYEDTVHQVYVAAIRAGFCNMTSAVVAMQLKSDQLFAVGYAREGLIRQNICEGAFRKLADAVYGKRRKAPRKPRRDITLIAALVIGFAVVGFCRNPALREDLVLKLGISTAPTLSPEELAFLVEVEAAVDATAAYNDAVEVYNLRADEYNRAVALVCIDNVVGLPDALERLATVSEGFEDVATAVRGGNDKEKIAADTATVLDLADRVGQAVRVVGQINAPSGTWVAERLGGIAEITGTQLVTEEMNPDGLLGKEGGYSDCVYFAVAAANPTTVPGDSIVAKGTDGGGAVEIYTTLADAEARVAYLAGFDGTVLYSGSYAILGTMVIRTSYRLTNGQQMNLTAAIAGVLTALS